MGPLNAHGGIFLNNNTPQATGSPAYLLGIKAFNEGGQIVWQSSDNVNVGSATTASIANTVLGSYTANGGQQNPNYFGTNKVGFLMMNTTVNGNSQYKDWIIMDCYSGNDVGGGVALGVNRQSLGAYIMRSDAARTSWAAKAELLHTSNYGSYGTYSVEVKAPSFYATSDARLKENFQLFTPKKSILDLPIYKFDFIDGLKNQIGCKAQDLQEICPEIVGEENDGYLSIQESKIVYLLIDEIK